MNINLNKLYKYTQMQITFGIINLALVGGESKCLNLRELISHYLNHQVEIITRRTRFDLDKDEKRAHIVEGLLIAQEHIDEIIKIIRNSKDDKESKPKLMVQFGLTEIQATAILDMQLRRLSGMERDKLESEYADLVKEINYFKEILSNHPL